MVQATNYYTELGEEGLDSVEWETRTAQITGDGGEVIFKQENVEVPTDWSENALNIVASKYFFGSLGDPTRESSIRQLIGRVSDTITQWGKEGGYFDAAEDAQTFQAELEYILVNQIASFNSPVWFNIGAVDNPQGSACFINSVEDNMDSIMDLATREAKLFKWGSGTGTNISTLRSSKELVTGGGYASGPISFMRGYDSFANVIKSGGRTRRSAKMLLLDVDHPDIIEFIRSKAEEERKAWALIDAGYDGSLNGDAYSSVSFQNANHSVRVSDAFMEAYMNDEDWKTCYVTTGETHETLRARDIMQEIARATHQCGDPGIQFDDTINNWHTSSNTDRIYASNPCSEFVYLNDTACNLSSINLMKFYDYETGNFDWVGFDHVCRVMITAQEIIVSNSSYPSEKIAENSEAYRPLGLGYANLGALLMVKGLPYDSESGRMLAGAITSLMTAAAYDESGRIAIDLGPFDGWGANQLPMKRVMKQHHQAHVRLCERVEETQMHGNADEYGDIIEGLDWARAAWERVVRYAGSTGLRNSQVTVLAPTGTISFMMDCTTTGVEPDISLIKYKTLSGGGYLRIVNELIERSLENLGYNVDEIEDIVAHIDKTSTIEGSALNAEHLPVFDCAFTGKASVRSIAPSGHVEMLGAVQPFLSGAVSKTVNVPQDATEQDIIDMYVLAWEVGAKAVAVYRDNSKRVQPLTAGKLEDKDNVTEDIDQSGPPEYHRNKLSDTRVSRTHKFEVGGIEGYITVGEYDNGMPGEVFLNLSKQGSITSGLLHAVGVLTSISLQSGVPIHTLVGKFAHTRFEPSGWTGNPDIGFASSVLDYVFRWIELNYPSGVPADVKVNVESAPVESKTAEYNGDVCLDCGGMMTQSGSCHTCTVCGSTSGCG